MLFLPPLIGSGLKMERVSNAWCEGYNVGSFWKMSFQNSKYMGSSTLALCWVGQKVHLGFFVLWKGLNELFG